MKMTVPIIQTNSRTGKLSYHFTDAGKMILFTLCAFLSFSCRHKNDIQEPQSLHNDAPVVKFSVDLLSVARDSTFTNSNESQLPVLAPSETPADISLSQANMTDLWLFEGTTLLAHQTSGQPNFGSPEVELSYGSHTITFVASSQSGQSFTAGTWHADKAADCFGDVVDIDVVSSSSSESIVLHRCTYGLKWQSTDLVPTGTRTLRLKISPMRENLTAGLHAVGGYERTYTYDVSDYIGRVVGVTAYGLPEDYGVEEYITTTIEFLSSTNAVLYSHTKTVPVLTNRKTIISGALFNGSAGAAVRLNSQWLDDYEETL